MNRPVFWALVRKDLYLMRGLMIITAMVGLAAFALMQLGGTGFAVGGILFLTANVAGGIFIAMFSVLTDRVKNSRLFALSLPISGAGHDLAKLVSGYLSFGIPWLLLTGVAVLGFFMPGGERGMLVYGLMLQGFVLALFAVMLTALFLIKSETLAGLVILPLNIAFSLFMVKLNQPDVSGPLHSAHIVWTPFSLAMLAGEALALVASLGIALLVIFRNRDHV
jgi:hypothetical protein